MEKNNKRVGRGRPKGQFTMESWMIANGKKGDIFQSFTFSTSTGIVDFL